MQSVTYTNPIAHHLRKQPVKLKTCIRPHKYVQWPQMPKCWCLSHLANSHTFWSVRLRWRWEAAVVRAYSNWVKRNRFWDLTLQNRNTLPDLPHSAFPSERLFPGANWTLTRACQSLFPGPCALGSVDTDGLPGKASETLSALLLLATGPCWLLKCQNPDFCCKTHSPQYSLSISSRQESSWVWIDMKYEHWTQAKFYFTKGHRDSKWDTCAECCVDFVAKCIYFLLGVKGGGLCCISAWKAWSRANVLWLLMEQHCKVWLLACVAYCLFAKLCLFSLLYFFH